MAGGDEPVNAPPAAHVQGVRHLASSTAYITHLFKSQPFQRRPSTATNALSSRRRAFLEVYNLKHHTLLQRHSFLYLRLVVVAHWKVHVFCGYVSNCGEMHQLNRREDKRVKFIYTRFPAKL
jgi:hypothetical protein